MLFESPDLCAGEAAWTFDPDLDKALVEGLGEELDEDFPAPCGVLFFADEELSRLPLEECPPLD